MKNGGKRKEKGRDKWIVKKEKEGRKGKREREIGEERERH